MRLNQILRSLAVVSSGDMGGGGVGVCLAAVLVERRGSGGVGGVEDTDRRTVVGVFLVSGCRLATRSTLSVRRRSDLDAVGRVAGARRAAGRGDASRAMRRSAVFRSGCFSVCRFAAMYNALLSSAVGQTESMRLMLRYSVRPFLPAAGCRARCRCSGNGCFPVSPERPAFRVRPAPLACVAQWPVPG